MVNFADLEAAYRRERQSNTLEQLPATFFEEVRALSQDPSALEYKKIIDEMIESIYSLRINKLIHYAGRAAFDSRKPKNALEHELSLYKAISDAVECNRAAVFSTTIAAEHRQKKEPTQTVRMTAPIAKFMGHNGAEYGPYKSEQKVELPIETAKLLISKGAAENP